MATLENTLHSMFANPSTYRSIPGMPGFIQNTSLSLPSVNDTSEKLKLVIRGIDASLVFGDTDYDDTATGRIIATDILRAAQSTAKTVDTAWATTYPGLVNFPHRFAISQLMSVKLVRIHRGRGRILGIAFSNTSTHSTKSTNLYNSLVHLCITNKHSLWIGAGLVEITLHPVLEEGRYNEYTAIENFNKTLISASEAKIIRDVSLHPAIFRDPLILAGLANALPDCSGIIPNLSNGRHNPTFTVILGNELGSTYATTSSIQQQLIRIGLSQQHNLQPLPYQSPSLPSTAIPTQPNNPYTPPAATVNNNKRRKSNKRSSSGRGRGGRGRGSSDRGQISSIRKHTTSSLSNPQRSPVNSRYYAIINPAGGISMAHVGYYDYDAEYIREFVTGVSYNMHRKFDIFSVALAHFQRFYPQCNTPEDITFMNHNAPLECSNLNNYIPQIRTIVGDINLSRQHSKELTWVNGLDESVLISRRAASARMIAQGKQPEDHPDFLPDDHPRGAAIHPTPPATNTPKNNAQNYPPSNNNNIGRNDGSHFASPLSESDADDVDGGGDCDVSTMTEDTNKLSINNHQTGVGTKRARANDGSVKPRLINLAFAVPLSTTTTDLITTINTILQQQELPPITDSALPVSSDIRDDSIKTVYISILDPSKTKATVSSLISTFGANSKPHIVPQAPSIPSQRDHIDFTPPAPGQAHHPACPVLDCPHYNGGLPYFDNTPEGFQAATTHGTIFHHDLYTSHLPDTYMQELGWGRCCTGSCNAFFCGSYLLEQHREQCTIFNSKQPSPSPAPTSPPSPVPPQAPLPTEEQASWLFTMCPPSKHDDLRILLQNNTDITTLQATVMGFMMDHQASRGMADHSTPNNNNNNHE